MFRKNGPILLLAWTSGCLDALGFLGLGRVFTANMTGNTVLFGMAIAQGDWSSMLRSLIAILGFSLGVVLGSLLIKLKGKDEERVWTPDVTRALLIEVCLLLIFALLWVSWRPISAGNWTANLLIGISALAMGQQSATALSLGLPGVSTTYITGTITTLMMNIARLLSFPLHIQPTITSSIENHLAHEKPARLASVWLMYSIAAIIGGYGELHMPALAAFFPLSAILAAITLHYSAFRVKAHTL